MELVKVSIITVVYNNVENIQNAIQSVLRLSLIHISEPTRPY